jgi:uncharacterized protein with NAD-binding domain and iron-sulfur cluster
VTQGTGVRCLDERAVRDWVAVGKANFDNIGPTAGQDLEQLLCRFQTGITRRQKRNQSTPTCLFQFPQVFFQNWSGLCVWHVSQKNVWQRLDGFIIRSPARSRQ